MSSLWWWVPSSSDLKRGNGGTSADAGLRAQGGFTPQGLLVCTQLSALGAQLILLTPMLQSSRILQLVHLLREGTSNALIYAEECDITDLDSVTRFADQWNKGEGSGGQAGGVGAGPASFAGTTAGGAPSSSSPGADGGAPSGGPTPRRVEAIVFLPVDEAYMPTRYRIGQSDAPRKVSSSASAKRGKGKEQTLEVNHAEILGRFHLVNSILPSLLLLPPHRDVRIVSLMSPWYAAAVDPARQPDKLDLDWSDESLRALFPRYSPWRIDGTASLLWFSLSRELQRRIQLLTEADPRPRTKLPGIEVEDVAEKVTSSPAMTKRANVNVVNVCAGFERSRDVLEYLLPPRRCLPTEAEAEEAAVVSKSGKKGQGAKKTILPASPRPKGRNPLVLVLDTVRYFLFVLLFPLAWFLCKSPKRVAETITWAVVAPLSSASPTQASPTQASPSNLSVFPGELHREGKVIRPPLPRSFLPGESALQLWSNEEKRVQGIVDR